MLEYLEYFFASFFLSTLFATGGVGSSIVLIPVLAMMGVTFDLAKAAGLVVNTITTTTASVINYRQGKLNVKKTIPFLITSAVTAPLGASCSQGFDTQIIKLLFAVFLIFSAALMLYKTSENHEGHDTHLWLMYPLGAMVGFMAGLLGIGGGALIIPALYYMSYPPMKIASTVSFMIPMSTFVAFIAYVYLIAIDWTLIIVVSVAAVLGGKGGTYIMHNFMKDTQMKYFLSGVLFLIGIKMLINILQP